MLVVKTIPIRPLRERINLTQEELARVLGTSWTTVSRWERGQGEPPAEIEEKIHRLDDLVKHIDTLIAPQDMPKFLLTPNPAMDGFPPSDLLQSGFAYRRLVELVEKAKSGEFS